jgi:hypothetical protein
VGLPKLPAIPTPEEIAETTRVAMQPMMDELVKITGLLDQILAELQKQNQVTKVA